MWYVGYLRWKPYIYETVDANAIQLVAHNGIEQHVLLWELLLPVNEITSNWFTLLVIPPYLKGPLTLSVFLKSYFPIR